MKVAMWTFGSPGGCYGWVTITLCGTLSRCCQWHSSQAKVLSLLTKFNANDLPILVSGLG
jgi:hypothetical protein